MSEFRTLERQDLNDNFALLIKALQGDVVIKLSRTTAAPTAAACAANANILLPAFFQFRSNHRHGIARFRHARLIGHSEHFVRPSADSLILLRRDFRQLLHQFVPQRHDDAAGCRHCFFKRIQQHRVRRYPAFCLAKQCCPLLQRLLILLKGAEIRR